ncbi:MAG TPA: TonB-dependent receptor [Blastocatellia bacterium]|nr:TonB-dependent receptor [Blastocatellia bacterium]
MRTNKFRRVFTSVITTLVLLASVPLAAFAQTANTGTITGVVKDQSGAVVPGAIVKATNIATGVSRTTTTSDDGVYELTTLPPADYRMEIEASGFAKYLQEPVTVNVLARVTVDAEMRPAGATEQVTVTGESVPLIETTKTEVSGVIDQRQMENLPVNGRSFASLATLIPGATLQPSFDPTKARVGTFSVGGSTGRNLNITVDGGDNKDNAVGGILQNFTMEGIQEFALSTQRFSAANGRSGGALLSVVSKSGTNELHGSAFGFFRDDKLNANAAELLAEENPIAFENPADAVKPPFGRQQFGGSIGGPFVKDKAFWFGAYERTRERGNSVVRGDAQAQIRLLEPLGYQAVQFLPQPFDDHQYTVKTDFNIWENHSMTFRFAGQNNDALNDQAGFLIVQTDLSGGNESINDLYSLLGTWTWTASARVVNQFAYQFSDFDNRINATTDLPLLVFPNGLAVGRNGNVPQQTIQRKNQFRDDLTWNRGKHGWKFGVDYTWIPTLGGLFAFNSAPEYDFNFDVEEIVGNRADFPQGFNTPGVVGAIFLSGGDPSFSLRDGADQLSWYVQDDWKVTPRFTLNLGVRYDVDFGFVDSNNQVNNRTFRFLQIIGSPFGERVVEDDKNNFSPRIGMAWDISGDGRSVLRGGYGMYYDQSFLNVPLFAVQLANPEIYATFQSVGEDLSLSSPPPDIPRPLTQPRPGARGRLIDPDFESPYSQQFNIGFAQELWRNASLEFDYVHIIGLHEFTGLEINPRVGPLRNAQFENPVGSFPRFLQPLIDANRNALIAEFGIPNPFGRITVAQSDGRSRYDAFTVSFKKRYANRFQLNSHYTLSRAVAWFGTIADFGLQPINPFNKFDPAANFGYTPEDERHRFVLSGVIDMPWGFQVSPILQLASARPFSIFPFCGACDINRDGVANDRQTRDGNDQNQLPPATERGDDFKQVNVRVSKFFNFTERKRVGVFFEAFNVFNTANFGNQYQNVFGTEDFLLPVNFFGATGFSEPLGIPFQAQFGFRFNF